MSTRAPENEITSRGTSPGMTRIAASNGPTSMNGASMMMVSPLVRIVGTVMKTKARSRILASPERGRKATLTLPTKIVRKKALRLAITSLSIGGSSGRSTSVRGGSSK